MALDERPFRLVIYQRLLLADGEIRLTHLPFHKTKQSPVRQDPFPPHPSYSRNPNPSNAIPPLADGAQLVRLKPWILHRSISVETS